MKLFGVFVFLLAAGLFAGDEDRVFRTDAVALQGGEEVTGDAGIHAEHQGVTYHFANKANRDTFLKNPDRYAMQLGGACARMGPLSGKGDPARWTVHGKTRGVPEKSAPRGAVSGRPMKTRWPGARSGFAI